MPDSPMKDSEHQPLEAVEGIGIQLPSNGIQRSGHSRLPSEASSVDSIGSWSTETPSEAWDSSTSVDQSARNSVEPATPKIVNGDSSVEKAEKTEKIFELLSSTPADFILQEQEEPVTPTEKTMRKHLMPSSGPTEVHTRGRSTTTSNNEEARARPLQISRKPIQRTISSPPSIRRSKSVPRPLHIPPSASKQVINSTSSTRNKVVHDAGPERQSRSTAAPQHTKPTHLHLPPVNSQVPSGKPTPSLSTDEPPEHNAATTPLPQLPIQTYLHLALASPPLGPGVPLPSLNPAQPLETKYPYIPSDSPDLILERITNFIYLPPHLESVLWFGMLACLDSWLYTFTILPLRFLRAVGLLIGYWWSVLKTFWKGGRRLQKKRNNSAPDGATPTTPLLQPRKKEKERGKRVDRERKISGLLPQHKADLLKGAVVIVSCFVLTGFDASKMYHSIRGQAAIKLYVLYNVLEVFSLPNCCPIATFNFLNTKTHDGTGRR